MALFEWSTPERRRLDQALPIMPNEIYLSIIEVIAPPATALALQQLKILSILSRTCRFFANVCLPRIFEFVQFSGPLSISNHWYPPHEAWLGSILCTQIAEKQPLAFALAQSVKGCRFLRCWDGLYENRCIAAMSHMKNIRKVQFSNCSVDGEYWRMLVALPLLEDLAFDSCKFPQDPVHTKPEKSLKLKLSQLRVIDFVSGHQEIIAFVDTGYLRTLAIDFWAIEEVDWLRQSAITELHLYTFQDNFFDGSDPYDTPKLNVVLVKAPRSLQALRFTVGETTACIMAADVVESMLVDPAWKDLSSLCSFTLRLSEVMLGDEDTEFDLCMNGMHLLMLIYLR